MKKTINGLLFSGMVLTFVAMLLLLLPASGHASCPDRVTCYARVRTGPDNPIDRGYTTVWKGNILTPTCWKVGHQCAPWNCGGNSTTSDYWVNECIKRFNIKATQQGEQACIIIPEIKHSEQSLDGYHFHCNDLPFMPAPTK